MSGTVNILFLELLNLSWSLEDNLQLLLYQISIIPSNIPHMCPFTSIVLTLIKGASSFLSNGDKHTKGTIIQITEW